MFTAVLLLFTNRGKRIVNHVCEVFSGAYIPSGYIYGIDVSHFQGEIHWDKVGKIKYNPLVRRVDISGREHKDISFVIAKTTEGSNSKYDDKDYAKNYQEIRDLGLILGAYHVLSPGGKFDLQAKHYIETCNLRKGDIRPILDVEADIRLKGEELTNAVKQWIEVVEKHYGCKPIIYTSTTLYSKTFATKEFQDYDFWIAQYYNPNMAVKSAIWQFTSHGRIEGIDTRVDLDVLPNGEKSMKHLLIP